MNIEDLFNKCELKVEPQFKEIDKLCEINSEKVLSL